MKRSIKLFFLLLIISSFGIRQTGAYFSSTANSGRNSFSSGCWVPPSVPVLDQPADNSFVDASWDANPKFDWQDSSINCSLSSTTEYRFEIYDDAGMTILYYRSGWLNVSEIVLPAMPDGDYYWRVKSKDEFGNESSFSSLWKLTIDRIAPVISGIGHSINSPGAPNQPKAIISWTTNELATSNLRWRTNPADPWTDLTEDTTVDNTNHSREIDGLTEYTTYYIEVRSADGAGNSATSSYSFTTSSLNLGLDWLDDIVINEFLPNPLGLDDALMPNGEWIELYNRGGSIRSLVNWYLTDRDGSRLDITFGNTTSSDSSTIGLDIAPGEFVVVYRNGNSAFEMNNDFGGDEVNLYSSTDALVDQHSYSVSFGDEVLENKSFARYPDGTDSWFDPIPTAGGPNKLEEQCTPQLNLSVLWKRKVSFEVTCATNYKKLDYELTYFGPFGEKGITGSVENNPVANKIQKDDLKLGTCSEIEGKVCVYDEGITKIHLKVTLLGQTGGEVILEKEENY